MFYTRIRYNIHIYNENQFEIQDYQEKEEKHP